MSNTNDISDAEIRTNDPFQDMPLGVALKARSCLKRLAKSPMRAVPEYMPIAALEKVGLAIRGKETKLKGVYNYRISPAGKAWLAKETKEHGQ